MCKTELHISTYVCKSILIGKEAKTCWINKNTLPLFGIGGSNYISFKNTYTSVYLLYFLLLKDYNLFVLHCLTGGGLSYLSNTTEGIW